MTADLLELSHGKTRPPRPSVSRLDATATEAERSVNHDALGRFTHGNKAPVERSVKQLLKRQLGKDATVEAVQQLYKDTRILFLAELARMPNKSPAVQRDLASRARWSAISAWYTTRATEVGLDTDAGVAFMELALKLDARAERLGITALAISERLAKVAPKQQPWWMQPPPALTTTESSSDVGDASEGQPGASNEVSP